MHGLFTFIGIVVLGIVAQRALDDYFHNKEMRELDARIEATIAENDRIIRHNELIQAIKNSNKG